MQPPAAPSPHSSAHPGAAAPTEAGVEVRYWAAIRAAAGTESDRVPAGTLADVLGAVAARHAAEPRFAEVLALCSALVAEQPVGTRARADVDVPDGATVDLLPPFAGGSRHPAEPDYRGGTSGS